MRSVQTLEAQRATLKKYKIVSELLKNYLSAGFFQWFVVFFQNIRCYGKHKDEMGKSGEEPGFVRGQENMPLDNQRRESIQDG